METVLLAVIATTEVKIVSVEIEAKTAIAAVGTSVVHETTAGTSVVRVVVVPLAVHTEAVHSAEAVPSAEAAHVAEAHSAAAALTEEVLMVVAHLEEARTAAVMDTVADSADTAKLTASAHAPLRSSYAVFRSWPCHNTLPESLC